MTGSLISAVAGQIMPGPGSIYISQSLNFKRPVYFEDTVTAFIKVTEINVESKRAKFLTVCMNQEDKVVIEGEAIALVPPEKLNSKE